MKRFNEFINEEFNIFGNKKNSDILNKIKEAGLKFRTIVSEDGVDMYHTFPKNGFEFTISSDSDGYLVQTSYYGTQYSSKIISSNDLVKHFYAMMSVKPNITHKFSVVDKQDNKAEETTNDEIKPKPVYSQAEIDRFKRTVEEMGNRNQKTRKQKLTDTFFNEFIGVILLNSEIQKFDSDFDNSESSNYGGITIYLSNGDKIYYTFNINSVDNFKIDINKENVERKIRKELEGRPYSETQFIKKYEQELLNTNKLNRSDLRTLAKIAKKINPNTKYSIGTKSFNDDGFIVKEYESKKYRF